MRKYKSKKAYSVIVAILLVWFMLVVSSWVFKLIYNDMLDTRWQETYLQAFSAAEWSMELALLKLKKGKYLIEDSLDFSDSRSEILWDISDFKEVRDSRISYQIEAKTDKIESSIKDYDYSIVPLFYFSWSILNPQKVTGFSLTWTDLSDIVWNIIWSWSGISWVWEIGFSTDWNLKILDWYNNFEYSLTWVTDFLNSSDYNYLVLFNSTWSEIYYELTSWDYFWSNKSSIISSAKKWKYKQNLRVEIDNSKYLNLLKYSIYSK